MKSTSSTNDLRPSKGHRSHSTSTQPQNKELEAGDSSCEDNKGEDEDDCSEGSGGLSDCDERNGEEREYAKKSPTKGKQHLNSKVCILHVLYLCRLINEFQALVKVEDSDEYELKAHPRVTNKDLPALLAAGDTWTKKIIPTLFRWIAAQDDPWTPTAKHLEDAIQTLGCHYADEEYVLDDGTRSPEFQLVRYILYFQSYC